MPAPTFTPSDYGRQSVSEAQVRAKRHSAAETHGDAVVFKCAKADELAAPLHAQLAAAAAGQQHPLSFLHAYKAVQLHKFAAKTNVPVMRETEQQYGDTYIRHFQHEADKQTALTDDWAMEHDDISVTGAHLKPDAECAKRPTTPLHQQFVVYGGYSPGLVSQSRFCRAYERDDVPQPGDTHRGSELFY